MLKTDFLSKFLSCLMLGVLASVPKTASAQPDRGGPGGFIQRLDRNQDGRIDSAEAEAMPGMFRDRLEQAGLDVRRGFSTSEMERAFSAMREQRGFGPPGGDRGDYRMREEGDRRGGFDRRSSEGGGFDRGGSDRGGFGRGGFDRGSSERGGFDSSRGGYDRESYDRGGDSYSRPATGTVVTSSRTSAAPASRITVPLPETYGSADIDRDGQIGLYEWQQWKRGAIQEFLALDLNGDGFLTPHELLKSGPVSLPAGPASGTSAPATVAAAPSSTGMPSGGPSATPSTTGTTAASTGEDPIATQAAARFRLLDANRDNQLTADEWEKSRVIRSQFTEAGIPLDGEMSRDSFVEHYIRLEKARR